MTVAIKKIDGVLRENIKKIEGVGNDPFTKSLLHFNGTDASTTFTDESGKTWTAVGNAQLDTADKKFGSASLLLDRTGGSIITPNNSDFDFGTGDFTIDFWTKRGLLIPYSGLFSTMTVDYVGLEIDASTDYKLRVISNASGTQQIDITSSTALDSSWTHIALVRNGNTLTLYLNGNSVGTRNCTGYTYNSSALGMAIGRNTVNNSTDFLYDGWIDEFRVSKGIARWTSNFTPPLFEYRMLGVKKFMGVSNV